MPRWWVLSLVLAALSCSAGDSTSGGSATTEPRAAVARAVADAGAPDWPSFGHDPANTRSNVHETVIDADSVGGLTARWQLDDLVGVTGTPTVVDGTTYFGDWSGTVRAIDPTTAEEVWSTPVGGAVMGSAVVDGDGVFVASGRTLTRLDRATGTIDWQADVHDHPFAMVSASPVVAEGLVVIGVASGELTVALDDYTFRGSISAYDVETGLEAWRTYTTADDGTGGAGVGIWSTPAVDAERGLLFVGTGNTYEEPTSPLADSVVAVELATGDIVWSTQFTNPDAFSVGNPGGGKDADVGAAPNLWSVGEHDLVGAGDKAGVYRALDRDTGEIVWETTLTPGSVFGGDIGSAAFVDGTIVVASNVGDPATNAPTNVTHVFGLDAVTGEERWRSGEYDGLVFAPVSAVPGVAFVGTTGGLFLAFDIDSGEELWRHEVPNQVGCGPSIVDGMVLWGYGFVLFGPQGPGGLVAFGLE